jgi:hypothetical protein
MILANIVSAQFYYPQIKDINVIRRICGEHPQFLPVSTVNGALATLQILRLVQEKPHQDLKNYRFGFWTGVLDSNSPELPYRIRSCHLEKSREVPLRAIPEGFTRWSKVCVPESPDLTPQNLVNFLQVMNTLQNDVSIHSTGVFLEKIRGGCEVNSMERGEDLLLGLSSKIDHKVSTDCRSKLFSYIINIRCNSVYLIFYMMQSTQRTSMALQKISSYWT